MDPLEFLPVSVSEWRSALESFDAGARSELGNALLEEWIEGRLEPRLLGTTDAEAVTGLRSALAGVIRALGFEAGEWVRHRTLDESSVRRWCWIEPWALESQDEDLFLMDDAFVVPLLEEAAAACAKRDYAIAVVEHHLRDQAHAALHQGWDAALARIAEYERWLPAIRAARAPKLLAYAERLLAYRSWQKLTRALVEARVKDLWRCHEPPALELEEAAHEYRVPIDSWSGNVMVADKRSGALRVESPKKRRGR